jgi:hypothetical protein
MRSICFLIEPQNQGRWFVSGLTSKPLGWVVSGLASKPLDGFFQFYLKTGGYDFVSGLASKPLGRVFRFESQNR